MAPGANLNSRYERCLAILTARNQHHVLRWWDELGPKEREQLLADAESIPWDVVDGLIQTHVLGKPQEGVLSGLEPPRVLPHSPLAGQEVMYGEAIRTGRDLIRAGKVAAFTVAGGQGTRLGFDGPKGAVVVTPVGHRSLFEILAQSIRAAQRRYDHPIRWYIMTSPANHAQTAEYFARHEFFGLSADDVMLFSQGVLPAFDFQGRLLLDAKHRIALAPDGHGGSLTALVRSGALADMRLRGVSTISYFQVDNPLVKPFDPLFLGLHVKTGSQMSTKVTPKADDLERVGNVCVRDGKTVVIEYSDFPEDCARARNSDGTRKFNAGNLAIHLLAVDFVDRVVGRSFPLPVRRAEKKVAYLDENGALQRPGQPNAVKLETFIFDMLPLAGNPLLLEVDRAEEFSPVKNAGGRDSLETARRAQTARACRWLEAAGVKVPRKPDGHPDVTVAISPLFALDAADIETRIDQIPTLVPGGAVYIE